MPEDQYTNSRRSREEAVKPPTKNQPEDKKIEKVISGKVVRRKKPLHRRFVETFFGGEDAENIGEYLLKTVVVPYTKDLVTDFVTTGVEKALYGEPRGRSRSSRSSIDRGHGNIRYDRMSDGGRSPIGRREDPRREVTRQTRTMHSFGDIILETRHEASAVLDKMEMVLDQYKVLTVAELYDMLDVSSDFTDRKFGWVDNIRGSQVVHVTGGYFLDIPQPIELD